MSRPRSVEEIEAEIALVGKQLAECSPYAKFKESQLFVRRRQLWNELVNARHAACAKKETAQ